MSQQDRDKWNRKYSADGFGAREPSRLLTPFDDLLPRSGKALDVAGGAGRHAIWLAKRGLDVTLCDISEIGLETARQRAAEADVCINTLAVDLELEPFPNGPWDVIVSFHYLNRPLLREFANSLCDGGWLVFVQPTMTNLQRHEKPPRRFLLDDGELPQLLIDLEIVHYEEGWLAEGRHDALLVARRNG